MYRLRDLDHRTKEMEGMRSSLITQMLLNSANGIQGVRSRNGENRTLSGAVLKLVVFRFSSNSNKLSDL